MVSYGIAKARAKAWRTDWNERTEITKAIITWVDSEYENPSSQAKICVIG